MSNNIGLHLLHFTSLVEEDNKEKLGTTIWIGIVWSIWNLRNDIIFNGISLNLDRAVENLKIQLWFWVKANFHEKKEIFYLAGLGILLTV
ncbi:hypothetical protein ACS0TY_016465 [Phlomoides rotata]